MSNVHFPLLPPPPSWFPGHMARFSRMLPGLLSRTNVVLELRDSRLPLTSINPTLEGALRRWQSEQSQIAKFSRVTMMPHTPTPTHSNEKRTSSVRERIVVLNKRDLVPKWGIEPFKRAMATKFPDQSIIFASWRRAKDLRDLSDLLVSIAMQNSATTELNVLVVGMPNVGKSTLLNALRNVGIRGSTPKALRTSAHPGLTRVLSTRLKLREDAPVYAYDSPGVMLPFLGHGDRGAERGVKLALIAGIKEGLYDVEPLAAYLLYRLNLLNPASPSYLKLLPESAQPTSDVTQFLEQLAQRLGMLKRGGVKDVQRASAWFIKWWREEGGLLSASSAAEANHTSRQRVGWGFDFEWDAVQGGDVDATQAKMEECIDAHLRNMADEARSGGGTSKTQKRKQEMAQRRLRREAAAKRLGKRR